MSLKLLRVFALADELGISIEFESDRIFVLDEDGTKCEIINSENRMNIISILPPITEYTLLSNNPEFGKVSKNQLLTKKISRAQFWKKSRKTLLIAEKEAQILAEQKRIEEERQKRIENEERKLLAQLKAKYE